MKSKPSPSSSILTRIVYRSTKSFVILDILPARSVEWSVRQKVINPIIHVT